MKLTSTIAGIFAAAACVMLSDVAQAEGENQVVVELFTSQGCSACPPADELLSVLAKRSDVLPLALHVDYWDYIGWADTFARPENTARQKKYAHLAGTRTIYTPQMVVDGQQQIVGTRPLEVAEAVMQHLQISPGVMLTARRAGDTVEISAPPPAHLLGDLMVQLVRYIPEKVVAIERGENAGKTLTYSNIVTDWKVISTWSGEAPLHVVAPVTGEDAAAVILQQPNTGRIVAAKRVAAIAPE